MCHPEQREGPASRPHLHNSGWPIHDSITVMSGEPKKQTAHLHSLQSGYPYWAQGLFRALILVESSSFHFLHSRFEVFYELRHSHRQIRRTHAQGPCRLGQ